MADDAKDVLHKLTEAETASDQAKKDQDLKDTVATLRAQVREKERIIAKYRESHGGQIELAREICSAVKAVEPYPRTQLRIKNTSTSEVPLLINMSDWHVGEMTRPAETGGMGAYNFAIAEKRAANYTENILAFTEVQRRAYNIKDAHIFGIGDYISGSIHQELLVTNEFPLPVQTAKAGWLIAESIRRLASHFDRVIFHGVGADNHGRLQSKPQAKQKAANNMSYLVHSLIEAYLTNHKNVKVIQYEDMRPIVEVASHPCVVMHGDTIRAVMSIPYYGMAREKGREAVRQMLNKKNFDYIFMGHWHVPAIVEEIIYVNGSLSGTSEWDHSCGRFAKPAQVTMLMHPKWGEFGRIAWRFEIEQEETDARRIIR